jgi:oligopeptide/dipeptide ABC transporter ATP-binding protein
MDQPRKAKLDPVEGQPPDLMRLDLGCAFQPRCKFAVARCREAIPVLEAASPGHHSACFEKTRLGELRMVAS